MFTRVMNYDQIQTSYEHFVCDHASAYKMTVSNTRRPAAYDKRGPCFMFSLKFPSRVHPTLGGNHHLIEKWPGAVDDLLTHVPFVARMPTLE